MRIQVEISEVKYEQIKSMLFDKAGSMVEVMHRGPNDEQVFVNGIEVLIRLASWYHIVSNVEV